MAWIFALWAQCRTGEEASAFAAHFAQQRWSLRDGVSTVCSASIEADTCCWIQPSNVSRSGVTDETVAAQLAEVGTLLHEHLRTAPAFLFALVGVEVDDVRTEAEMEELARDTHRAYQGLVVSVDLWQRAGQPPGFDPFRPGHLWRRPP
ncbi:MAG: hypothetical protein R3B48_22500 [Kofleriaceae bacterium]